MNDLLQANIVLDKLHDDIASVGWNWLWISGQVSREDVD